MENITIKTVFCDSSDALEDVIDGNPGNGFIRSNEQPRPMPFLWLDTNRRYILRVDGDGLIVGGLSLSELHGDLCMTQVSVRPEHRNQGHAKKLLNEAFNCASLEKKTLLISHFEPDGKAYLAPMLPEIHSHYPALQVVYPDMTDPICGKRIFSLDYSGFIPRVVYADTLSL